MTRNHWIQFACALVLCLGASLTACEAAQEVTSETLSEDPDRCDPLMDLETCDGAGRLQCDVVSRIWVFIGTCEPMTHCVQVQVEEPGRAMTTQCVLENEP